MSRKYEQIYFHSDETIKLYNDYETCYNDIQAYQRFYLSEDDKSSIVGYVPEISETTQSLVKFFENNHDCAGICQPSLFYFSRDISEGLPKQSCLEPIQESIGTITTDLGWAVLSISLTSFMMLLSHYPLWLQEKQN